MGCAWFELGWRVSVGESLTPGQGAESRPRCAPCPSCPSAAVALSVDLDDRAVVHQLVHRSHRHGAVGEHVLPLAERLVAGHQQRPALVAVHHQLEQHRGLRLVLADVANVVNHQQGVAILT